MAGLARRLAVRGVSALAALNRRRLPEPAAPHPFLSGVHTPMDGELTLGELEVEGRVPPELDGRYLRIGPNPLRPDPRSYHWFVGDGMVHGVRLREGRALWYRNRFIRSRCVAALRDVPEAPGPRHGGFDTVNTNVVGHAGAAYALVEAGSTPVRLDDTLDRQAYGDFAGTLSGGLSAHPHRDPATGDLHAVCYAADDPDHVRHVVVGADGRVRRELKVPVPGGPLVHDCAITERYVLIFDLPVTQSVPTLLKGYEFPFAWNPDHPARLGLLPLDGAAEDVVWIPLDPCFIFHAVNAYELPDGRVVLDAVVYDCMFTRSRFGPDENPRGLERWTIDSAARTVETRTIDRTPQEFPRLDERLTGRPYRYAYALGVPEPFRPELVGSAPLLKHDLQTGERLEHPFGPDEVAGEFVFVPAHADAEEDEGWLMGLVIDTSRDRTELRIIDARRFAEPAVASVRLPHRIPPGFHGNWIAAA